MEIGLIGLPGVGKSTLFRALVGAEAAPSGAQKATLGVAEIPDGRLETIAGCIETRKLTHATLQLVDLPGLDTGGGAQKAAALLGHIRTVDAVGHVVRCFEAAGLATPRSDDPGGDISALEEELILADLVVAESTLEKARRPARTGDMEAKTRVTLLERVCEVLGEGRPLRSVDDWNAAETPMLRGYGLLTFKRSLYIANVAETDMNGSSPAAQRIAEHAASTGGECVAVCATLEAEIGELDDVDRQEMLDGLGVAEPAIGPLARALNRLLGLICFYTAGPKEVRAWPVTRDASAPAAAGTVHSDMERGFIRAECYHIDDLLEHRSEKAVKSAGKLRIEGKSYQVRDGDIMHFLFNV